MRFWTLAPLAGLIMAAIYGNAEGKGTCGACVDELGSKLCRPLLEKLGELNGCQAGEEKQKCMAKLCLENGCLADGCQKTCNEHAPTCPVPIGCEDAAADCKEELARVLSHFWKGKEDCQLEKCKKIACYDEYFVQNCRRTCQPHTRVCSGECVARSDDETWCSNEKEQKCGYFSAVRSYDPECKLRLCEERSDVRKRCPQLCNPGCTKYPVDKLTTPFFDFSAYDCSDKDGAYNCKDYMASTLSDTCDGACACKTHDKLTKFCRKTCHPFTDACKDRCFEGGKYCFPSNCQSEEVMQSCPRTCLDPKCVADAGLAEGNDGNGNGDGGNKGSAGQTT